MFKITIQSLLDVPRSYVSHTDGNYNPSHNDKFYTFPNDNFKVDENGRKFYSSLNE